MTVLQIMSLQLPVGSLRTTIAFTPTRIAKPAIACLGSGSATEEEGDGHPQQEHHRVVGDALSVQERARRDRYGRHHRRQEREAAPEEQRQEVCE